MATKSFNRRFHGRCGGKFSFFRNPFVFVILWLVVAAGIGAIVMLLWNWLMPVIFGLPALSLWQALGLLVLMRILFGSFGFGRRGGSPSRCLTVGGRTRCRSPANTSGRPRRI